jgi:hypothetical protein
MAISLIGWEARSGQLALLATFKGPRGTASDTETSSPFSVEAGEEYFAVYQVLCELRSGLGLAE